jgi:hypothetical protein
MLQHLLLPLNLEVVCLQVIDACVVSCLQCASGGLAAAALQACNYQACQACSCMVPPALYAMTSGVQLLLIECCTACTEAIIAASALGLFALLCDHI